MARRVLLNLETLNDRITPSGGQLDPTFGKGGIVTTPIGTADDEGENVAIDSHGRIIVAGISDTGGKFDFAVTRYNSDGSLDLSFGAGGKVTTALGPGLDFGVGVVVDSTDRILVVGKTYNGTSFDFGLVRYDPNGNLDTSFDGDGIVTTSFGPFDDLGFAVAIDSTGRIVVAGYSSNGSNSDFAVARYFDNGSIDASFGVGGIVTTPIQASDDFGYNMAIDHTDRIVVVGSSFNGTNHDLAIVRYDITGALDGTFGSGGLLISPMGRITTARSM